jgi:hypothetical protein
MHNLQTIVLLQSRLRPLRASHDFAIKLYRNAISLHAQSLDKLGDAEGFVESLLFTIDEQAHENSFPVSSRKLQARDRAASATRKVKQAIVLSLDS